MSKPENAVCADPYKRHPGVAIATWCPDHIVPHKGSPALFWDLSNWQPLCQGCNSYKAAREEGGFGNETQGVGGSKSSATPGV
jgi:5-methylcytosine-specific restriction protein A